MNDATVGLRRSQWAYWYLGKSLYCHYATTNSLTKCYKVSVHIAATGVKILDRPKSVLTSWPHQICALDPLIQAYCASAHRSYILTVHLVCSVTSCKSVGNGRQNPGPEFRFYSNPLTLLWAMWGDCCKWDQIRTYKIKSVFQINFICTYLVPLVARAIHRWTCTQIYISTPYKNSIFLAVTISKMMKGFLPWQLHAVKNLPTFRLDVLVLLRANEAKQWEPQFIATSRLC